jgi:hypothetical protein
LCTDEEGCVSFDAQCDVAAVVYGAADDPDRLISGFAADLRRSGGRPVGVVQLGRSCRAENPRLGVVMLPDGEVVRLASQDFAPQAAAYLSECWLDRWWLAIAGPSRPRSGTGTFCEFVK